MTLKRRINGNDLPHETPIFQGNKTSPLNVLSEDGFNIIQTYEPNEWTSIEALKSYIKLSTANNFILALSNRYFYKPTVNNNGNYNFSGVNIYDNCNHQLGSYGFPQQIGTFRINLNDYISQIYTVSPFKEAIWGYHITEEASYFHWFPYKDNCLSNFYGDPSTFKNVEVPPSNVLSAITYLKSLMQTNAPDHKYIIMEANHGRSVLSNTYDGEGIFNPQDYLHLLNKNDKRDIYFEGSYVSFPYSNWINQNYIDIFNSGSHYLGQFKSIDYAKSKAKQVHKILNIESTKIEPHYWAHYHSNPAIQNANWLWFEAYTSIIHGVDGIWFWQLDRSLNNNEIDHFSSTQLDKFNREKFPENYRRFISNLAKELRLLEDQAFLNNHHSTIIYSKTEEVDKQCIVPSATTYIPSYLPSEKRNELYGLRYTLRTNGEEVIMIITNPLNVAINTTLNFSNCSNQIIRNSTAVQFLFESSNQSVSSSTYKTNRNSNINLENGTSNFYNTTLSSVKSLNLNMGPLDVKILKFISEPLPSNSDNAWLPSWTNQGNSKIADLEIDDNTNFLVGDFDGDGAEELLYYNRANNNMNSSAVLKFIDNDWQLIYYNNNRTHLNGTYNNFFVGDFDGDGKDEILANTYNGISKLFKFSNNEWSQIWTDSGNINSALYPYKQKLYIGDFDGDGKDEILGVATPGWTTMFSFNNNDFIWKWSDMGNTNTNIYPYRQNLKVGDFDGDGIDEVLGLDGWATILKFQNNTWNWVWSNYGVNGLGGWQYPLDPTDQLLIGNIDNDLKEELFFIQNRNNADWSATIDLKNDYSGWNWNWTANSLYSSPYINNWPVNSGYNPTKYLLVKAQISGPKQLLAFRKYCNSVLANMYKGTLSHNKSHMIEGNLEIDDLDYKPQMSQIYPNPSNSHINITSTENITSIECYSLDGKKLIQYSIIDTTEFTLALPDDQNSIYLLKVYSNNYSETHRIIKVKQ